MKRAFKIRERRDRLAKIAERYKFDYIISFQRKSETIKKEQERKCSKQVKEFAKYLRCIIVLGKIAQERMFELVVAKSMSWSMVTYNFDELPEIYAVASYLIQHGFYRESLLELRYSFESMIQAYYLDRRHPDVGTDVKMEILKEVKERREYQGKSLINALKDLPFKQQLLDLYSDLSSNLHPRHVENTFESRFKESIVDCERFSMTTNLMCRVFDATLFILMNACPNIKRDILDSDKAQSCLKNMNALLSLKYITTRSKK
jgi:hypothetical protein